MNYMMSISLSTAAALMLSAAACEPDDDFGVGPIVIGSPGPDTPYVYSVDETRIPAGLTLSAFTEPLPWNRYFTGDIALAGDALVARAADTNSNNSVLYHYSTTRLRMDDEFALPEPHEGIYAIFPVMQIDGDLLYTGKEHRSTGVSAVFDLRAGGLDPIWIADDQAGGSRGRAVLIEGEGVYTFARVNDRSTALLRLDPRTGDTTHLARHAAIDSTWAQELSGFTEIAHGGERLLVYFVRSYSEAISAATFRVCAYDLAGDSLRYDVTPESLGLRPDQSTSIYFGNPHENVIAFQLGHQYAGFDPFARKVLWTHDEIEGVLLFANAGEYPANDAGIVVFPSNGAAPTCGIDVATGEVLWVNDALRSNGPLAYPVGEDHFLYRDINGALHYLEARTGAIVWSMRSPTLLNGRIRTRFSGTFAVDGRDVYVHDPYRLYKFRIE